MGLGHNDPWVDSHMWPQQTWGERSSKGQWTLAQVFEKKGHCIHILWHIFMGLGYNDPWVQSHMWPQQKWGQKSSWGNWPFGYVFWKIVSVSTYFDLLPWELDTFVGTATHETSTYVGSEDIYGSFRVIDLLAKVFEKNSNVFSWDLDIMIPWVDSNIGLSP